MSAEQPLPFDHNATLEIGEDWSAWLAAVGDTISTYTVTVPTGITKVSDSIASGVVSAVIKETTPPLKDYSILGIVFKIVTTGGRTDERTYFIQVQQR